MKKLPLKKTKSLTKSAATAGRKPVGFKTSLSILFVLGIGLFAVSGFYWYKVILTNPTRVMSDVLDKSLQSTGVTRSVTQESGSSSIDQTTYVAFSPNVAARSVTELNETSEEGATKVTTETIGTQNEDFVRYNAISIEGTTAAKRNFDSVLGVWGKRTGDAEQGSPATFLNDALFTVVPFGNLNAANRGQLKKQINETGLYNSEKSETKTTFKNGRPVMTFSLQIDPESLVKVLAQYVEITNVGSAESLNPAQYKGAASIPIDIEVDLLSRHVNTIKFVSTGRTEVYHSYNARNDASLPKQTVDVNELQARLQAIEGQQ